MCVIVLRHWSSVVMDHLGPGCINDTTLYFAPFLYPAIASDI